MRAAIIGLLIGFGLGWIVFAGEPAVLRDTASVDRAREGAARPVLEAPLLSPDVPEVRVDAPDEATLLATICDADPVALRTTLGEAERYTDTIVDALLERARVAFEAGRRFEFFVVLGLLEQSAHPRADAYFVELIRLERPESPWDGLGDQGDWALRALGWRDVPGAREAIRARLERYRRDQGGERLSLGTAWHRLVLRHGTDADAAWLIDAGGGYLDRMARAAIAEDQETAMRYLELLAADLHEREGPGRGALIAQFVGDFAMRNPEAGRPLIERALWTGEVLGVPYEPEDAGHLALALPTALDRDGRRISSALERIDDPVRRYAALRSVLIHNVRGISPALLRQPLDTVRQAARDDRPVVIVEDPVLQGALGVILRLGHVLAKTAPADPSVEELLEAIDELVERLAGDEQTRWRRWLAETRAATEQRWK